MKPRVPLRQSSAQPQARVRHGQTAEATAGGVIDTTPYAHAVVGHASALQPQLPPLEPGINQATAQFKLQIHLRKPSVLRRSFWQKYARPFRTKRARFTFAALALLIVVSEAITIVQPMLVQHTYAMGSADSLLQKKDTSLASKLTYDSQKGTYNFNAGFTPANATTDTDGGGPQITAIANQDLSKGITVTDPVNKVDFTMKPQFSTLPGKQDGNRLLYPLADGTGWVVYTMQATMVKEDIVLNHANGDSMKLNYRLDISSQGLEARKQSDGSVGVFGSSLPLTGDVSTGDSKDAALLQKARDNAKKDKLLFTLPTPIVYASDKTISKNVKTSYELSKQILTTVTTGLKDKSTSFPLDIDPAVTVNGAADLFRDTNPDSNTDFDSSNSNISRGSLTGGILPAYTQNPTYSLNTARFLAGSTIYDDYAYVAGGTIGTSTTNTTTVEYAKLNTATPTTSAAWATTTALPVSLSRFQLIAYNGYLYAIGGSKTDSTCATPSNLIYYTRIQVNGQLSGTWSSQTIPATIWTGANGNNLCGVGATISGNTLYMAGGRIDSTTTTGIATVAHATLNPDGSISTFTADASLSSATYDLDIRVYSGYIYAIGGMQGAAPTATVLYAPLNANGSIYGSWKTTSSFISARSNLGTAFTAVSDGFIYLSGGCTGFTNQSCSTIDSTNNTQIAVINADGTLGPWTNDAQAPLTRVGATLVQWRQTIFSMAGCTAMPTTSISCSSGNLLAISQYSQIPAAGELSPLKTSSATANQTTGDTNSLPVALASEGTAVLNGYIYVIGGCLYANAGGFCQTNGQTNTTNQTYYAAIGATGKLGAWQNATANTLNGTNGLAAFGTAVYNGRIYVLGGYYYNSGAQTKIYSVQPSATTGALPGTWTTLTAVLPAASSYLSTFAYRGNIYAFGGCTASTTTIGCSTYLASPNNSMRFSIATDGVTLTRTALTALPVAKAVMATAQYGNYFYLTGGADTNANPQTNNTMFGKINADLSITWQSGTSGSTVISSTGNTATGTALGTTGQLPINSGTGVPTNTTYYLRRATSYIMNGYLYVIGGHNASDTTSSGTSTTNGTTYPFIFIGKINLATGDIATFTKSVTQITARWDASTVYSNGYMYVIGGCSTGYPAASCSVISPLVQYTEIYNASNKATSAWANQTNKYTGARTGASVTIYNGYIYVVGGCSTYTVSSSACSSAYVNTTYYAPINPDGTIGTWAAGGVLSTATGDACLAGVGGYLYYIGGLSGANVAQSVVNYTAVGSNGAPAAAPSTAWSTVTPAAFTAVGKISCATYNGHIYVVGGMNASNAAVSSVSYSQDMTAAAPTALTFTAVSTSYTTARYSSTAVIAGGYLYVLGGFDGTNYYKDVQFIGLNPTSGATTGSWAYSADLPTGMQQQNAFAANGYIYLTGGRSAATTCSANTWVASVNSPGTTSTWTQGATSLTTARFGAAGAYYNGYYYVSGGDDCTNVIPTTNADFIQSGGEQSQAMEATFSKYADLNGDGTPQKLVIYLTNAQLNGVDIEKWKMTYISSREADNSWGAPTTISPLVNQNAYSVNAYNSGGTNQTLARWYYLSFSIDMTQSFTFTDDVQPTIYQYGLHYSPPTSKRLLHGRDFRDQTQQGEDLKL